MERKKLENRIDDDLAILDKRIEGYVRDTKPIIEELNNLSDVLSVKGVGDVKTVNNNINKAIKHLI